MLNKIHILKDEDCEMMCIMFEEECLFEGNYRDFNGKRDLAELLRQVGFSVTEEGYTYE